MLMMMMSDDDDDDDDDDEIKMRGDGWREMMSDET